MSTKVWIDEKNSYLRLRWHYEGKREQISLGVKDDRTGRAYANRSAAQIESDIDWAITTTFKDWLAARGGDGSIEIKRAIDNIQHLLTVNEFSDRVFTLPENGDRAVRNLLAYRKLNIEGNTEEFWVPTTVFDREFCDGVNKTELVRELQRIGLLLPPRPDGKAVRIRKIKGKANYFYVFGKSENGGDTGDTDPYNPYSITVPEVSPSITYPKTAGDTGDPGITSKNPISELVSDAVSPVSPQKTGLGKISKVKVGDRVRYVGGMVKHNGKTGTIAKVCGDRYICDFSKKPTEQLSCEKIAAIGRSCSPNL